MAIYCTVEKSEFLLYHCLSILSPQHCVSAGTKSDCIHNHSGKDETRLVCMFLNKPHPSWTKAQDAATVVLRKKALGGTCLAHGEASSSGSKIVSQKSKSNSC